MCIFSSCATQPARSTSNLHSDPLLMSFHVRIRKGVLGRKNKRWSSERKNCSIDHLLGKQSFSLFPSPSLMLLLMLASSSSLSCLVMKRQEEEEGEMRAGKVHHTTRTHMPDTQAAYQMHGQSCCNRSCSEVVTERELLLCG
jgi:hypothetical protein